MLTVVGAEAHLPYRRPPLSKELLSGTLHRDQLLLGTDAELEARWLVGRRAVALDPGRREVVLEDGEPLGFDGLVIATGAAAKRLPNVPNLEGVHVLRTLEDATALHEALGRGRPRVVVVGAGFIGSEVASSCRALGVEVTVVDPLPRPLASLGPMVGEACAGLQRDHGVDLRLGCSSSVERGRLPLNAKPASVRHTLARSRQPWSPAASLAPAAGMRARPVACRPARARTGDDRRRCRASRFCPAAVRQPVPRHRAVGAGLIR